MYKDKKRYNKNGYVVVNEPQHHKAFDATGDGNPESFCVYEHVLIAEEILDRSIKEGEVVHHLDRIRSNNSPDNLLVLSNPMHTKLHQWLDKHEITPNEKQQERIKLGCIRCKVCEKPIQSDLQFCSHECADIQQNIDNENKRGIAKPTKEVLQKEVQETPMTKLGQKYGVSDNAVKKWCKNYEIDLPPMRGHWTKKKFENS